MKIGLIAILILFSLKGHSQSCKPNNSLKVVFCPHLNDSTCTVCSDPSVDYRLGLVTCDKNYTIARFTMMVRGADNLATDEAKINSSAFSSSPKAMKMIADLKTGDTVYFYCIEARSNNGEVFILQPMSYKIN
jgi:hypothetical protein